MLHGKWCLSSPTRDWTCAPCSGSSVLTAGPPGKSLRCYNSHCTLSSCTSLIAKNFCSFIPIVIYIKPILSSSELYLRSSKKEVSGTVNSKMEKRHGCRFSDSTPKMFLAWCHLSNKVFLKFEMILRFFTLVTGCNPSFLGDRDP